MSHHSESPSNDGRLLDRTAEAASASLRTAPTGHGSWFAPRLNQSSYCQTAWTHKKETTGFLLFGACLGILYAFLKTPEYKAVTTVELVGINQSFLGMSQVDPQAGTDTTTASPSNIQTQTRILTSSNMVSRVAEGMKAEITSVDDTPATLTSKLRKRISFLQSESPAQKLRALNRASGSVTARGVGASRLIEISCESTSPDMAATFVNMLAKEHISQTAAARSNVTQRTSQWMDSQFQTAKSRLQDAGRELSAFVENSGVDFFPEQSTLADSKLRALQADVASAQADRIEKQSRWEMARNASVGSIPDIFSDPTVSAVKARLVDLRREIAQDLVRLTPNNPKVQQIQVQLAETEKTLESEKQGILKRLQNDYEESQRRENLLAGAYDTQTRTVSSQSDKASRYASLKRAVDMAQQLYNVLLQQSTQAALVAVAPTSNIRVLDPAVPAKEPVSPMPILDIPVAALGGGAIGCGILYLMDARRQKKSIWLFDSPGSAQAILGVPEFGIIPSAQPDTPNQKWGLVQVPVWLRRTVALSRSAGEANGLSQTSAVATWRGDRSSILAESFRQTLVSILRNRPVGQSPFYVVTSAGPSEGKTTVSANLSVAMAESGIRVLLVEGDLRSDHLPTAFAKNDHKGLSDLLLSPDLISNLFLDDYIQPSGVQNLEVITNGVAGVETPALLFFSPRVQQLVARLRARFDWIILDTAPVLPFPDARLWGRYSDGVVLIVRSGVTARECASAACQRFQDDGIPVLGSILNDWAPRNGELQGDYLYEYGSTVRSKCHVGASGGKV